MPVEQAGDHTLQFVIAKYGEAALRLGRDDLFLPWARRFANLLEDEQAGYWRKPGDVHLAWCVVQFKLLLEADPRKVQSLFKWFRTELKRRNVKPWVWSEWKRRVRRIKKQAQETPGPDTAELKNGDR